MYGNYRQKDFFWGAVVGGALTMLSTLLFTTKKGKMIQQKIADAYEGVEDSVKDALTTSKEKVEETVEEAQNKLAPRTKQEDHPKHSK